MAQAADPWRHQAARSSLRDGRGQVLATLSLQPSGHWLAQLRPKARAAGALPSGWDAQGRRQLATRSAAMKAVLAALAGGGSAAARKARERQARRSRGLVRFEAWVSPAEGEQLRALLQRLRRQSGPRDGHTPSAPIVRRKVRRKET